DHPLRRLGHQHPAGPARGERRRQRPAPARLRGDGLGLTPGGLGSSAHPPSEEIERTPPTMSSQIALPRHHARPLPWPTRALSVFLIIAVLSGSGYVAYDHFRPRSVPVAQQTA